MALVKIISGEINSGKTTTAASIFDDLAEQGRLVAGFLSVSDSAEKKIYYLKDVLTGRRIPAAAEKIPEGEDFWMKYDFSRFFFSDRAFAYAEELADGIITADDESTPYAVLIDELGPLELQGYGSFRAVGRLLSEYDGILYLVIRESVRALLCEKLGIDIENAEIIRPPQAQ